MAFITWQVTPEKAFGDLAQAYIMTIQAGVMEIAEHYAPIIEADMKTNHPWQNRTGNAEAGLRTEVNLVALRMVEIILAHGVDVSYSWYLETRWAGRWAVINPTLDMYAPRIWADVVHMLR